MRVELVDRGDDLRLLILERILAVRSAHVAVVGADLFAVLIGVRLASGLVLAQGGEVVQHVKEGDGVVTFDGVRYVVRCCAGIFPGDRQFLGGVFAGDRLQRLEAPLVEGVVDHNIGLEGHLVAGADRLHAVVGSDQVRKRSFFVGAEVVAGATVVEVHKLGCLLRVHLSNLGLVGNDHVGRVAERLIARSEPQVAMSVQRVIVGHRVRTRNSHEHALIGLACLVASWKGVELDGLGSFKRFVELCNSRRIDLRLVVVFAYCTSDLQRIPELRVVLVVTHVDEDAVGSITWVLRSAGTGGLEEEAVLATFVVHRRDDAFGGHRLTFQRRLSAGALDFSDRGNLTRLRLFGLRRRICRILRDGVNWSLTGATRGRGGDLEVCSVVVGVDTEGGALDRGRVRGAAGRCAFRARRAAPADEVNLGVVCIEQDCDRALAAEVELGGRVVGVGDRVTVGAWRARDQERALRGHNAGERVRVAGVVLSGALLDRPAGDVDGLVGRVVKLDEVLLKRCTLVTATAVDLVDDDIGTVGGCRCSRGDD